MPEPPMPATSEKSLLSPSSIRSRFRRRPSSIAPAYGGGDSQTLRGDIPGGHVKNLFVKDKKGRLFLLVLEEDAAIDLKRVHEKIGGQGRVSFGSAELLEEESGACGPERGDAVRRHQRQRGAGHRSCSTRR